MVGQRMKPQENVSFRLKKHYAWGKKTLRRPSVSLGKTVFSPCSRKKQPFFLRKQNVASEFFCPWHNVSSQKEHIFLKCVSCNTHHWTGFTTVLIRNLIILNHFILATSITSN